MAHRSTANTHHNELLCINMIYENLTIPHLSSTHFNIVLSSTDFSGMEQMIFTCMGIPTEIESDTYRTQYVRLFGRVSNKKGPESARCAVSIL